MVQLTADDLERLIVDAGLDGGPSASARKQ